MIAMSALGQKQTCECKSYSVWRYGLSKSTSQSVRHCTSNEAADMTRGSSRARWRGASCELFNDLKNGNLHAMPWAISSRSRPRITGSVLTTQPNTKATHTLWQLILTRLQFSQTMADVRKVYVPFVVLFVFLIRGSSSITFSYKTCEIIRSLRRPARSGRGLCVGQWGCSHEECSRSGHYHS